MDASSTTGAGNARRNTRAPPDPNVTGNGRPTAAPPVDPKLDRRKDFKLTHCQEKDGVWTGTAQFGRESRHSKRAEVSYDKKKFKFTQKDEQGNKHEFEIAAHDIESKCRRRACVSFDMPLVL